MKLIFLFSFLLSYLFTAMLSNANASEPSEFEQKMTDMIKNDRTGACLAVAKIGAKIEKTIVCADPKTLDKRKLNFDTAFEIGSISKVMTSHVLAGLIRDSDLTLDTPLSTILPKGTDVPEYEDTPITLKHLITHSSGLPALPSRMSTTDTDNPYAALSEQDLLGSLQDVVLTRAPGSQFEYSNYAMMLLSFGLAHHSGQDFEALLKRYVYVPIGMTNTFSGGSRPRGIAVAEGHSQVGTKASQWNFPKDTQGVGGIRASLNDMIRYAQANLNLIQTEANGLLTQTHQEVLNMSGQSVGMNWMTAQVGASQLLFHEGGTGGFSSVIALNPGTQTGVVILSDTALTNLGGVGRYALPLFDTSIPAPTPRLKSQAPEKLLKALVGEYTLHDLGLKMTLWEKNGVLMAQATGQSSFALSYDSTGDFYPKKFDALLRPKKTSNGQSFDWLQGGGVVSATKKRSSEERFILDTSMLADYVGHYPLFPGFDLSVTTKGDQLFIQGTGQQALPVEPVARDEFSFDQAGAYFTFNRSSKNDVESITLKQGGQTLVGEKQ